MKKIKRTVVYFIILLLICGCEKTKTIEQQIAEQMELGEKYLLEQKYEEAIVVFNKAIEIEPQNIVLYERLAYAYSLQGNEEKMLETIYKGIIIVQELSGEERKEFVDYAEETLLEIIENHEQKGDLDKAIEIAEHGKEISEVISEKLEELIRKKKAEEKRKYIFEEGEELLEQLYQAAQNEDYSKISLLNSSEEADTIIWSNLGIDDSISYPEENGIQMQIYIKPVYDDSVYDEERGYWYLGTGVYYGNLVNGKKEGSGWAILDFAPENSPGSYQKFDGEWKNNAPNGNGELISVNIVERRQERIVGNYTDGLENGHMVNVSSKPDIVIQWDYDSIMGVRQKKGEDLYGDGSYVYSYGIYLDAEHKNATGNPSASVSDGVKCGIPGWRTE